MKIKHTFAQILSILLTLLLPLLSVGSAHAATSGRIVQSKHFAVLGQTKYPTHFQHFDYVNPDAPKGGQLRLAVVGNFDNFNRYASRGAPEINSWQLYDTLFTMSEDEVGSYYPLIALSTRHAANFKWLEVKLNPQARFSDNQPITAEDVVFSFNKFMQEGVITYRTHNAGVTMQALDRYTVRIELPKPDRDQMLGILSGLVILPKHFWQSHRLDEPLTTPPISSSVYTISDYKLGQYVVYQRNPNYWAKDLPVNRGRYNFDSVRYDYYLDQNVALEAFKAGEYDFRQESTPKYWFTQYQGPAFASGAIIKQTQPITTAVDSQWLAFNVNRPIFQDRRVRQALTLTFDFNWLNRAFYYNSYRQPQSYFQNTIYAATGEPSKAELVWLNPWRESLPPAVFGPAMQLPPSDGSGYNRENLLRAKQLLAEAGWQLQDGVLRNANGEPFRFELLTYSGSDLRFVLPWQKALQRLGIELQIAMVDYAQANNRYRSRDYDMMPTRYYGFNYPVPSLQILWGSQYLNSTWNASGLHSPAIDDLLNKIVQHQTDPKQLLSLGRALDRVLTHEYAMIPMWYTPVRYLAYRQHLAQPTIQPRYSLGLDTWWYAANQAASAPSAQP